MFESVQNVLLLAGRLGATCDGWPIRPFLERLAKMGIAAQVLCIAGESGSCADHRVVECPGLRHRWQQALAVRGLRLGDGLRRPDLLHVLDTEMGPVGLAIAERWQVPYVQTVNEFVSAHGRLRLSRRWCRGLIAASHELAEDLSGTLGVPDKSISVVPPGITVVDEKAGSNEKPRVTVIGTAGALVADSGFATFLSAARIVLDEGLDAEFVIAGQGEDEVDLRLRADRLQIADRVTVVGNPVVGLRLWNVLDIFCQTSIAPTVGRSLAVALALGVPSIATDIKGLRALIAHNQTGLRVAPDDPRDLADAILAFTSDPERARVLARKGQSEIRRVFDPETEVERLSGVYRRALAIAEPRRLRAAI